jgi:hypothetical protein
MRAHPRFRGRKDASTRSRTPYRSYTCQTRTCEELPDIAVTCSSAPILIRRSITGRRSLPPRDPTALERAKQIA